MNDAKHLLTCLSVTQMADEVRRLFRSFAHFSPSDSFLSLSLPSSFLSLGHAIKDLGILWFLRL